MRAFAPARWPSILSLTILSLSILTAPAAAFERVTGSEAFAERIVGRDLTRTGIRLTVLPGGQIMGRALGWAITGEWDWRDGYFCRTMDWSGYEIEHNCMTVLANGRTVRFIADRGAGEYADFRLR